MTPADIVAATPPGVMGLVDVLRRNGHAGYVVGGSLRDLLMGRQPHDWDLTTDARPERIQELFPGAAYENRFGTVVVRDADGRAVEVTTFRSDFAYLDHRRPARIEFGERIEDDLARRDFTINAVAWGGRPDADPTFVDPFGGRQDIDGRIVRAVGAPRDRFAEDALRMLRAVRLAAALEFEIDQPTLEAIRDESALAAHLSGERVFAEISKLLDAPRPSVGLRVLAETGLLAVVVPELAEQIGIAQNKIAGEDLWDHTVRSVDAAATAGRSGVVRLATLLHDVGKPETAADGHFYRHEVAGAARAVEILRRWHVPRETIERVERLIRYHMFSYDSGWSDAAIRRFLAKVGPACVDDLLALREADNEGSGVPQTAGRIGELRSRVAAELDAHVALDRSGLAIDGHDLIAELGLEPGPPIGRMLDELVDRVVSEPRLNERDRLLALAREITEAG
jgi:tRNA nucleotidyltransferase (CCA-adding enzyme)